MSAQHEIAHALGLTSSTGPVYLAWSGCAGCLTYLAVIGVLVKRVNCSVRGCWRPGLYRVAGTEHTVCRHHHPGKDTPVTYEVVRSEWAAARDLS